MAMKLHTRDQAPKEGEREAPKEQPMRQVSIYNTSAQCLATASCQGIHQYFCVTTESPIHSKCCSMTVASSYDNFVFHSLVTLQHLTPQSIIIIMPSVLWPPVALIFKRDLLQAVVANISLVCLDQMILRCSRVSVSLHTCINAGMLPTRLNAVIYRSASWFILHCAVATNKGGIFALPGRVQGSV